MANTTNLNLAKPAGTDKALVSVLNSNSDKIDAWAGTTNQALSKVNTIVEVDPSKAASTYPRGIFPIVWPLDVTIDGITSPANLRGVAVNAGYLLHAYVSSVNGEQYYAISENNETWHAERIALKSDVTPEIGDFGSSSVTIQGNDSFLVKIGKLVVFQLSFRPNAEIAAWSNILTIPGAFRPAKASFAIDILDASKHYEIYTNGSIVASAALPANTQRRTNTIVWYTT